MINPLLKFAVGCFRISRRLGIELCGQNDCENLNIYLSGNTPLRTYTEFERNARSNQKCMVSFDLCGVHVK